MAIYPDKKNGKLTGRFRVEVQKGARRARGRFDTLKEAQAAEAQWLIEMPTEAVEREDKRGVPKTLKDLWEKNGGTLWHGQADRDTAKRRLERMLVLVGAKTPLEQVTTDRLDEVVAKLYEDDLEGSTINKYLSSFHKLLTWARDRKWLSAIPVFPWQDEAEGRIRWITPDEEAALYRLLDKRIAILVRVAIATGMRRSELLRIEPSHVEKEWVHIWKSKTRKARSVYIKPTTREDIMWLLRHGMPTIYQVRYEWHKARVAMNLVGDPWFTFHACRHTCATRMVEKKIDIVVIKEALGHANIATTQRYAHVSRQTLKDAFSQVEVFQCEGLASSPTVGYASPTPVLGSSSYNLRGLKINFRYGQIARNVRGRGEIGRHAGFRFLEEPEQTQEDQE